MNKGIVLNFNILVVSPFYTVKNAIAILSPVTHLMTSYHVQFFSFRLSNIFRVLFSSMSLRIYS